MAESIILHFAEADLEEIVAELDRLLVRIPPFYGMMWRSDPVDYDLSIYDCGGLEDYEDEDLDRLFRYFPEFPTSSFCVELRRFRQPIACETAKQITIRLLKKFQGVADDIYSQCWTLDEILSSVVKDTGEFLDLYRFPHKYYQGLR